ncbi:MAG: hypothetical protein JF616_12150 [Fibrobacteres bacterium]|nr:hypothetical protein [Fibrobacterota bacterium]
MGLRIRSLAAAFAAIALSGCNKIGLLYDYADKLVRYKVEDDFDLDKAQRVRLKTDVEGYFQWHRKSLLPAYADFLSYIVDSARVDLRPDEIDSGYQRYLVLYRRTMEPVAEKSAALLLSLSPDQVDGWIERQRKKNRKLHKDFSGSQPERLEHRAKKIIDELEDWTGRLSKEQKEKIRILNGSVPWNGILWLDLREKVQERVAEMAKRKAPADSLRAYLAEYYLGDENLKSEEFRARYREFEQRLKTFIFAIRNLLTEEQRARFLQQVEKLAQDFRARSQQE